MSMNFACVKYDETTGVHGEGRCCPGMVQASLFFKGGLTLAEDRGDVVQRSYFQGAWTGVDDGEATAVSQKLANANVNEQRNRLPVLPEPGEDRL